MLVSMGVYGFIYITYLSDLKADTHLILRLGMARFTATRRAAPAHESWQHEEANKSRSPVFMIGNVL